MRIFDYYILLRKLAKSNYYQTIYSNAKDIGLSIFKNENDFTNLQIQFLQCLNFYSILNLDIYMGDVDEKVLDNFIYEDSYILYKQKSKDKESEVNNNINSNLSKRIPTDKKEFIFKSKKK